MIFIVLGTGLLKPNISTQVGDLYSEQDARRDAGFSIYYMGISVGAVVAPFAVGTLGQNYNYHLGFSLAAVGMAARSEEHTSELQSRGHLVCRLLLEKKKT